MYGTVITRETWQSRRHGRRCLVSVFTLQRLRYWRASTCGRRCIGVSQDVTSINMCNSPHSTYRVQIRQTSHPYSCSNEHRCSVGSVAHRTTSAAVTPSSTISSWHDRGHTAACHRALLVGQCCSREPYVSRARLLATGGPFS